MQCTLLLLMANCDYVSEELGFLSSSTEVCDQLKSATKMRLCVTNVAFPTRLHLQHSCMTLINWLWIF